MEIVILGKLGLDHRFCRELADSIAHLRVWAPGSEAEKASPLPSHTLVDPFGVGGFPGRLFIRPPLGLVGRVMCSICSRLGFSSRSATRVPLQTFSAGRPNLQLINFDVASRSATKVLSSI